MRGGVDRWNQDCALRYLLGFGVNGAASCLRHCLTTVTLPTSGGRATLLGDYPGSKVAEAIYRTWRAKLSRLIP